MRGSLWRSGAVVVATMSTYVQGVVLTASDVPQYPDVRYMNSPIILALPESASSMRNYATVLPLYPSGEDLNPWTSNNFLLHLVPTNQGNLSTGSWITYISCDQSAYPGNIGASDLFNSALNANVTAILLYSTVDSFCNITDVQTSYSHVYTMTNASTSQDLQDRIDRNAERRTSLYASISYTDQVHNSSGGTPVTGSTHGGQSGSSSFGSAPTTAVAMIILYSITGVVTALFLVIIVTGAVRAHRHPERYGPRNAPGRGRQTRARGMGRAILDTIPIIKFGEREPQVPKETDVELAEASHGAPVETGVGHETVVAGRESFSADTTQQSRVSTSSARSGIAPAAAGGRSSPTVERDEEAPGCSICTEDFELGEDLRVLPCDHKFHPACIDPWLLNVSGTCPLCRIDLNPTRTHDPVENATTDLPPPIDGGEAPASRARIGMRQSFLIGLGLGHMHDTTREDRLAAVRALREQQRQSQRERFAENEAAAAVDESSRRRRFRERFGIRTRQTGQEEANRDAPNNA